MATALDRILSLVDQTIGQVEDGQPVDANKLHRRLTWETVRAGIEFVGESDQRMRQADEQLFGS